MLPWQHSFWSHYWTLCPHSTEMYGSDGSAATKRNLLRIRLCLQRELPWLSNQGSPTHRSRCHQIVGAVCCRQHPSLPFRGKKTGWLKWTRSKSDLLMFYSSKSAVQALQEMTKSTCSASVCNVNHLLLIVNPSALTSRNAQRRLLLLNLIPSVTSESCVYSLEHTSSFFNLVFIHFPLQCF